MIKVDTIAATADAAPAHSVFGRIIVGVDGTEAGLEACRQAARLADPGGWLEVLTAVRFGEAAFAGWSADRMAALLEREAREALAAAVAIVGPQAESRLVSGRASQVLVHEVREKRATLLAVGTHGHSRATEIMIGGVSGEMLHSAPCSVLIARPAATDATFPRAAVVGVDGSSMSDAALAAGAEIERRFGSSVRVIAALRGKGVDLAHAHMKTPFLEEVDESPLAALIDAAGDADLLVVGSRGLHGLRALGSVSERVAHQAPCSVLVIRPGR